MRQSFLDETKILTPNRDPNTDKSTDTTKVQVGELMNFIGVAYKRVGKEILIEAAMNQGQLYHQSLPYHG